MVIGPVLDNITVGDGYPQSFVLQIAQIGRRLLGGCCATFLAPLPGGRQAGPQAVDAPEELSPPPPVDAAALMTHARFSAADPEVSLLAPLGSWLRACGAVEAELLPIQVQGLVVGALVVGCGGPARGEQGAELAGTVAANLSFLLENCTLYQDGKRRYEKLYEISRSIHAERRVSGLLSLVVTGAREMLGTDLAYLTLADDQMRMLSVRESSGVETEEFRTATLAFGAGIGGRMLEYGRPVIVRDYHSYPEHLTPEDLLRINRREGLAALAAAPLRRGGQTVGILYAGNRRPTLFTDRDAGLLKALAEQASVALETTQLLEARDQAIDRLQEANAALENTNCLLGHTLDLHRGINAAALAGEDMAGTVRGLARLLHRPVLLLQQVTAPRHLYCDPEAAGPDGLTCAPALLAAAGAAVQACPEGGEHRPPGEGPALLVVPVPAREEVLGHLLFPVVGAPTGLDHRTLEHAAAVLALQLLRHRTAAEVELRLRQSLLDDLLHRRYDSEEAITLRATHLSHDLGAAHRVVRFALDGSGDAGEQGTARFRRFQAVVQRTCASWRGALVTVHDHAVVALLPEPAAAKGPPAAALARSVVAAVAQQLPGRACWAGVGKVCRGPAQVARSHDEAVVALQLARISAAEGAVMEYERLGMFRFLLASGEPGELERLVGETLGALHACDSRQGSDLAATLRAYLDCNGHLQRTAEKLFLHVNTVKYRLKRIAAELGENLDDVEVQFRLRFAFKVADFLRAHGMRRTEGLVDHRQVL